MKPVEMNIVTDDKNMKFTINVIKDKHSKTPNKTISIKFGAPNLCTIPHDILAKTPTL